MWFTLRNTLRRGLSAVPLTLARTRVCRFSRSRIFSFIPHLAPVDFRPTGKTWRNARHECLLYLLRIWPMCGCVGVWVCGSNDTPYTHAPTPTHLLLCAGLAALAGFAADLLAAVADPLALIGFGLADLA